MRPEPGPPRRSAVSLRPRKSLPSRPAPSFSSNREEIPTRRAAQRSSAPLTSSIAVPVPPVVSPAPPETPAGPRPNRDVKVDGRNTRVRVPAPRIYQLTGELDLRFDGETVAWLLKNAERFVSAALSANSGSLPVIPQQRKRGRKRKKPIMPSISSDLSNTGQGSEPVEGILKKKRGRRRKQNLQITYYLKVSEALGTKPAKGNQNKGRRWRENQKMPFINNQDTLKMLSQTKASESGKNSRNENKENGHLEKKTVEELNNAETSKHLLDVLSKETQGRSSDRKIEERENKSSVCEDPFNIQSVCEVLSTQLRLRQRSDSFFDAHKEGNTLSAPIFLERAKKNLLILDLNGLLADIVTNPPPGHKADKKVNGKSVFKRPFCDDFLRFCFDRFEMAVWSSRKRDNVNIVVDTLMGDLRENLLFCWDQSKCTKTGFHTVENKHKPLFLKELKKIWEKEDPNLPWERGYYLPLNTLLLDDSPYKALRNPPYTAIFPQPYNFTDKHDNALGPRGELRAYLEELAEVNDVPQYVQDHPFGQRHITESNPSWPFYLQIIRLENTAVAS